MHLVPADRADHRTIDEHRACEAIAALGDPGAVAAWAQRFSLLADPGRLSLLVCIRAVGPISVTDLAVATGMNDPTVSQALRLLRAAGVVAAQRDGRIIRYSLADEEIGSVLARLFPARSPLPTPGNGSAAALPPLPKPPPATDAGH
jgi:ArsR family transcriptional regulator, lead/cadmium/zinc/bismuth-responsive transcriptional repressor